MPDKEEIYRHIRNRIVEDRKEGGHIETEKNIRLLNAADIGKGLDFLKGTLELMHDYSDSNFELMKLNKAELSLLDDRYFERSIRLMALNKAALSMLDDIRDNWMMCVTT